MRLGQGEVNHLPRFRGPRALPWGVSASEPALVRDTGSFAYPKGPLFALSHACSGTPALAPPRSHCFSRAPSRLPPPVSARASSADRDRPGSAVAPRPPSSRDADQQFHGSLCSLRALARLELALRPSRPLDHFTCVESREAPFLPASRGRPACGSGTVSPYVACSPWSGAFRNHQGHGTLWTVSPSCTILTLRVAFDAGPLVRPVGRYRTMTRTHVTSATSESSVMYSSARERFSVDQTCSCSVRRSYVSRLCCKDTQAQRLVRHVARDMERVAKAFRAEPFL